jgi:hypothetical protein
MQSREQATFLYQVSICTSILVETRRQTRHLWSMTLAGRLCASEAIAATEAASTWGVSLEVIATTEAASTGRIPRKVITAAKATSTKRVSR